MRLFGTSKEVIFASILLSFSHKIFHNNINVLKIIINSEKELLQSKQGGSEIGL
jgi:hypothetical protein